MKYIFLDIDGVLNNAKTVTRSPDGYIGISSSLGKRLRHIIESTDAKVVLTSSWKDLSSGEDYDYLLRKLRTYLAYPIGRIEEPCVSQRGLGINLYLQKHKCEQFVILDDYTFDFREEKLFPHLVLISEIKGLTDEDVEKAIRILNGRLLSEDAYDEMLMWGYHR